MSRLLLLVALLAIASCEFTLDPYPGLPPDLPEQARHDDY
jgi:hypothetical protein